MAGGVKRDHNGQVRPEKQDAPRGRFHDMFEGFRDELDQHHDRRERIIKASRDITALSKKIIFSLQRVRHLNKDLPLNIQEDIDTRLGDISKLMVSIAPDVQSLNRYRYANSLRCLEEFVEALSFMHYLRHQTLITIQETAAMMPAGVTLTPHDYLYGVFDLFGELMRFATVTTAQTGKLVGGIEGVDDAERRNILSDIHELGCAYEMLPEIPGKDYRFKMTAMKQSVRKVEMLGYGIVVRGSERPKGWIPDMSDAAHADHGSP